MERREETVSDRDGYERKLESSSQILMLSHVCVPPLVLPALCGASYVTLCVQSLVLGEVKVRKRGISGCLTSETLLSSSGVLQSGAK